MLIGNTGKLDSGDTEAAVFVSLDVEVSGVGCVGSETWTGSASAGRQG